MKLYRCPFSANAENLKAIPLNKDDQVDLSDNEISNEDLKLRLKMWFMIKIILLRVIFVTVEITQKKD